MLEGLGIFFYSLLFTESKDYRESETESMVQKCNFKLTQVQFFVIFRKLCCLGKIEKIVY